jgi:predicted nucleotidyltransferase
MRRHTALAQVPACKLASTESRLVPRSPLGERLIEDRAALMAAAARRHASNVRVFGSVVRGTDNSDSDIDLLVDLDAHATPFDLLELGCDLEDELGVNVDVGTPDSLRGFLRDEVLAEAVAL